MTTKITEVKNEPIRKYFSEDRFDIGRLDFAMGVKADGTCDYKIDTPSQLYYVTKIETYKDNSSETGYESYYTYLQYDRNSHDLSFFSQYAPDYSRQIRFTRKELESFSNDLFSLATPVICYCRLLESRGEKEKCFECQMTDEWPISSS